jgi:hypothetical protein
MGLDTPVNKPPDGQITCGKSFIRPVELARKCAENPIRGASRGLPPRSRFAAAGGAANRMFGLWEPLMTEERREKTNGDEDVAGPRRMLNEKQVLEIVPVGRTNLRRFKPYWPFLELLAAVETEYA